ncbi:MAG: formylglycine-generating enzyme family protein, partial [Planctomycetaceae bacterium]
WFRGNAVAIGEDYAHRVAQKLPNPFGLHDMHGNVFEWCSDWKGDYPSTPLTDPRGPGSGSSRVLRGGSWRYGPSSVRCAYRYYNTPVFRYNLIGFRLVVEAEPGSPAESPPAAATGGQPKEVVNSIGMKLLLIPA